jgi:hypothetical protein
VSNASGYKFDAGFSIQFSENRFLKEKKHEMKSSSKFITFESILNGYLVTF